MIKRIFIIRDIDGNQSLNLNIESILEIFFSCFKTDDEFGYLLAKFKPILSKHYKSKFRVKFFKNLQKNQFTNSLNILYSYY
jgi:hypothetical protein